MTAKRRGIHTHSEPSQLTPLEVFLIVTAVAITIALMAMSVENPSAPVTKTRSIRVQTSQTLWELARANPIEGRSTAQTVDYIRTLNQMETSAIQTGQIIDVPDTGISTAMVSR